MAQRTGAEAAVLTSALVVSGVWGYRKLVEPLTSPAPGESAVKRLVGLEKAPASAAEFAVGFGFTFFSLSVIAVAAPDVAKGLAALIAVGAILGNGLAVFNDVGAQVKQPAQSPLGHPGQKIVGTKVVHNARGGPVEVPILRPTG